MGLGFHKLTWGYTLRISLLFFLITAIATAFSFLPIEKILKDFLLWIKQDLGPWGPLVLAIAYIPLTVLAVPASVLTLGGGFLFGLPVGFIADSVGATIGATAAFLLGRTPITSALVYIGTTLKDLSDIKHGWNEVSTSHWVYIVMGFGISVIAMVCITRIAKASLDKALAEHAKMESVLVPSMLPIVADSAVDIQKPLMIRIDTSRNLEK